MSEQRAAGLPLDIEIQRVVFGTKAVYCRHGDAWDGADAAPGDRAFYIPSGKPWRTHHIDARPLPKFSTDYGAAMTLFEAMVEMTGIGSINADMEDARGEGFVCSVRLGFDGAHAIAPLPLAICRAALAAAGATEEAGDGR